MTASSNPDAGPVALPDEHGFRHALGTEDPGAVAKQYPRTPARDEQWSAGCFLDSWLLCVCQAAFGAVACSSSRSNWLGVRYPIDECKRV